MKWFYNLFKKWWNRHICDMVPKNCEDMFDDYKMG